MAKRGIFDWNEAKRRANIAKHDVDFTAAYDIEWDFAMTVDQTHNGEVRHVTFAPIADRVHVLVWTARAGRIRIISLRRANRRETKRYAKEIS